jgi:hypothetical protein
MTALPNSKEEKMSYRVYVCGAFVVSVFQVIGSTVIACDVFVETEFSTEVKRRHPVSNDKS